MYITCKTSNGFRRQSLEDASVNSRMAAYTTSKTCCSEQRHLLETSEPKEERSGEKRKTGVLTDHQILSYLYLRHKINPFSF